MRRISANHLQTLTANHQQDINKYESAEAPESWSNHLYPFPVCVPPGGHTVKVLLKIEISPNCLKIGTEPISSMLIMNMDKDFEKIVTNLVQMAHKVAQVSKN